MGNRKNKVNNRHRRHAYVQRTPTKQMKTVTTSTCSPSCSETTLPINAPDGSRIINLEQLASFVNTFTQHVLSCPKSALIEEGSAITIEGESQQGLASILGMKCNGCKTVLHMETSTKVRGPTGNKRWECNIAAVWGQMATGGGHKKLKETMATLGVPIMSQRSFITTERDIGEWWRRQLENSMTEAGKEEHRLAIERNDYHEGVPSITVVVDGGWSKRSHRHSYNAKSGVGVIIGLQTRKLLYIGVRNKECTACTRGIEEHVCFKNWDESSSAMETDIILEGFKRAERDHGLRYIRFIGDGDSSVFPTLIAEVPGWGRSIQKLECANHACKCYRANLEKLVQQNPAYKGKGGLTGKMRQRLTSAARCAIKMRSLEPNQKEAIKKLQADLRNGPYHCFGVHNHCSPDFCTTSRENQQQDEGSSEQSVADNEQSTDLSDIATDQASFWEDATKDDATTLTDARRGGVPTHTPIDPKMMADIQVTVGRLIAKAGQLIGNFTTNLAETWMHMRCKFDGGKVINRSQSGSFQHRCMGAGLRQNLGPTWGPKTWSAVISSEANGVFKRSSNKDEKKVEKDRKRKGTEIEKANRRKRKYAKTNDDSLSARKAYSRGDEGEQPEDIAEDVPPDYLENIKSQYYQAQIIVDKETRDDIENITRGQSTSQESEAEQLWYAERRKRVTASRAGGIVKMRKTTKRGNKVKEMLYTQFRGNRDTLYGLVNEETSRREYTNHMHTHGHTGLTVSTSGLHVSEESPWVAASPDGLVRDPACTPSEGLVELKNPSSVQDMTINEACDKKGFCIKMKGNKGNGEQTKQLDRNHDYYYQVQCQLYCTRRTWCDFVVRTRKDLYIERIYHDEQWWRTQLPKLETFFFKSLLPELACPRYHSGGIREPKET